MRGSLRNGGHTTMVNRRTCARKEPMPPTNRLPLTQHPYDTALRFQGLSCCAFKEVHGIEEIPSPEVVIGYILYNKYRCHKSGGGYVLTENLTRPGVGLGHPGKHLSLKSTRNLRLPALCAFIKTLGIGEVQELEPVYNPNENHMVRMAVWSLQIEDMPKMKKLWVEEVTFPPASGLCKPGGYDHGCTVARYPHFGEKTIEEKKS